MLRGVKAPALTAGPGVSLPGSAIQAMPGTAAKFRTAAGISGPAVPYRNGKQAAPAAVDPPAAFSLFQPAAAFT